MFLLLNIRKSQCSYYRVCSFKVFLMNKTWYPLLAYHQFHNVIQDWKNFAWVPGIWWLSVSWKESRTGCAPAQKNWSYQHSIIFTEVTVRCMCSLLIRSILCVAINGRVIFLDTPILFTYLVNKTSGIYLYPKFTVPLAINLSKSQKWSILDFSLLFKIEIFPSLLL